ncbi:MAG TPA: hypothetical protein PKA77_15580 [Chitinophagaceae bacterium]|jgi:hypothetical protein|nr:hypothetical protein [Chitinophagaceae bacterium]
MKKLLFFAMIVFVSCNSKSTKEKHENHDTKKDEQVITTPVNNTKWKADEATKKNVSAIVQVISDNSYTDAGKREELYSNLKAKIDILVKECSMKGADHDALHVWLEKVLEGLKNLKDKSSVYSEVYTTLKQDISSFYQTFE